MKKRTKIHDKPEPRENPEPVIATEPVTPPAAVEIDAAPQINPEALDPPKKNPRRGKRRKHGRKRRGRKKKSRKGNPMPKWAKAAVIAGAVIVTGSLGYGIYHKITTKKKILRCGEKYRHLAVTTGGQTLDNAYDSVATRADYEEWLDLAKALVAQANDRFKELGDLECAATGGEACGTEDRSGGDYPRWNALVSLQNQMIGKLDDLDSFWNIDLSLTYIPAIQKARAIVIDALCLMEKSDEGIQFYGGTVPVTPSIEVEEGTSSWKWFALGGGVAITLGGLGYALTRSSSPSGSAPHRPSLPPDRAHASRPE